MPKVCTIDDGMTRNGEVPAIAGKPSVDFTYRCALTQRVYTFMSQRGGAGHANATFQLLRDYLQSWDVADPANPEVVAPITDDVMKKVPNFILDHMADAICSWLPEQAEQAKN